MSKLEQFKVMCREHDLTYEYSDDGDCWRNGDKSFTAIVKAARELPTEQVISIWNKEVDRKISEGHRKPFYWKDQWFRI